MKHQLLILSAVLIVTSIGVRLAGLARAFPVADSVASAAVVVPMVSAPAIVATTATPSVHLEPAPSQLTVRPMLPAAVERTLTNTSFIIVNNDTGEVLQERRSTEPVPLASLTKLLAAIVVVDHVKDWEAVVEILPEDLREGEKVVDPGNRIRFADLFAVTLIRSSNTGMMALGRVVGLGSKQLAEEMNQVATTIGLTTTVITDPTGLTPTTVGTARDISIILRKALERSEIRSVISRAEYSWPLYAPNGAILQQKKVINTNELIHPNALGSGLTVEGGKTGFIPEAHYHVAIEAETAQHRRFIVVVLGAKTFDARFQEAKALLEWASSIMPVPQNNT